MEPLILQKKTEVLLNKEVYPVLKKYPKSEKFALCQEIKQAFYRVLRNTMLANNVKRERNYYLQQVDADLKLLLVLFSISREQKYITEKKCLQLQEKVSELGRITGGLMKVQVRK
ncbi:diversity-generating retroelement protein Avd [Clostridium botulinum]|uniref:diversity-generating retroelement protein Avd n=1 Tax=Clostridium botulinum TaxID=1491 RepID=UPI00249DDC91|nr:diversity-generating retroelement protein Avd [Clostridium botulinum]MDU4596430.1 diversity-generating retroelement protein Avd [Clostridium sporogenes]WGZ48068.1 diversity-generating retroelement protein Avd [Clostridium botulinum]